MNIWIFNHYATNHYYPGGTRHFDFARYLVKRGYKIKIFASSFHYLLLKETKNYPNGFYVLENVDEVDFVWLKTIPYQKSDWRRVINMIDYSIKAYIVGRILGKEEKPDIVIGSSVHLFAPLSAYFLSKYFNIPFILELRDLWPKALIDLGVNKYHPFIILLSLVEKFLYEKAHKIITLLPYISDYMKSFGVEDKLVYIPNGIDLDRVFFDEVLNKNDGFFNIAYAGAMGKVNDIDVIYVLVKAIAVNFNNVRLHIFGGGYKREEMMKELANFKDIVIFHDLVPKNEIYRVLSSLDILFFHIADVFFYGISCNKLFDYLAVGKPIIFFANVPNNIVEEAGAGITVKNLDEVIEAIKKLMNMSKEELQKMGQNGRKYVEKNYSMQILVGKLEQVIQEVYQNYLKK